MIRQILVSVLPSTWYNRSSTFGDYLSNKNPGRQTDGQTDRRTDRQTDRQTETGDLFLRSQGIMKDRENVKSESRPTDSITICTSFAYAREVINAFVTDTTQKCQDHRGCQNRGIFMALI